MGGGRRQADWPLESRDDDLKRELAEIRRQLTDTRVESTPGVAPVLTRVDRIWPDQTGPDRVRSGRIGSADRNDT